MSNSIDGSKGPGPARMPNRGDRDWGLDRWPGLVTHEPASGGSRSAVWRGSIGHGRVSVRRSGRSADSLDWELLLMAELAGLGFRVPVVVPTRDGELRHGPVVVQRWLDGRAPKTDDDRRAVASELIRLHEATTGHRQRPTCCTVVELTERRRSVDADLDVLPSDVAAAVGAEFDAAAGLPVAVIHGDPHPGNIRITDDGSIGLLDWDESRVDVTWHDLSNIGLPVLDPADHERAGRLSDAWEAATCWRAEPDYARRRLRSLLHRS